MKLFIKCAPLCFALLFASQATASNVACANNASTDPARVQGALQAGGTVNVASGGSYFGPAALAVASIVIPATSGSGSTVVNHFCHLTSDGANFQRACY